MKIIQKNILENGKKSFKFIALLTIGSIILSLISLQFSMESKRIIDIATGTINEDFLSSCLRIVFFLFLMLMVQIGINFLNVHASSRFEIDLKNNILYVAHGAEDKLYSKRLIMNSCNWIPSKPTQNNFECYAKFRYRQDDQKVTVHINSDHIEVEFFEKQRAITEGQFCVFYDEEKCLGGGVIEKAMY